MSAYTLDTSATVQCAHGAPVTITPGNARVKLGGKPAATVADTSTVSACPFTTPGGNPMPCLTVQWTTPAVRVRAGGQPLLLASSTGLCLSAAPQGVASVVTQQLRVRAT